MKITKHGIKHEQAVETFKCESCGCEFSAKKDEYYIDYDGASYTSFVNTCSISYTTKDYLVCSCPECHKIVKKIRERDNYIKSSSITVADTLTDSITVGEITVGENRK